MGNTRFGAPVAPKPFDANYPTGGFCNKESENDSWRIKVFISWIAVNSLSVLKPNAVFVCASKLTGWSLVEFDQHVTGLDVSNHGCLDDPPTVLYLIETRIAVDSIPPASAVQGGNVFRISVVVAVRSAKHHPVGDLVRVLASHQGIAGVSAVPGHRQPVLTDLITDGERRVFSRVPRTRSTVDLRIT